MEKMTKVVALEMAIENSKGNEELVEKLSAMLETEIKAKGRKHSESKVAKEKKENGLKAVDALKELDRPGDLKEIGELIGLDNPSPQKMSAIMKPLVDQELVFKTKGKKGKTFYSVSKPEEEEEEEKKEEN